MDIRQIVGANVKHIREQKGWVQEDLAVISKVSRTYIAQIEAGKRAVTIDMLVKLAEAFKVSASDLLIADFYQSQADNRKN